MQIFSSKILTSRERATRLWYFLLRSEIEAMLGVNWLPVASTILYSKSGTVMMHKGDIVFKQTFYQLKKVGIFNRWIRYETRTHNKSLRLNWQAGDGLILWSIEEVKSWTRKKQSKSPQNRIIFSICHWSIIFMLYLLSFIYLQLKHARQISFWTIEYWF